MNLICLDPSTEHSNPQTNSGFVLSCFKLRPQKVVNIMEEVILETVVDWGWPGIRQIGQFIN